MPKAIFHYFSGTGNTFHVAQKIAETLHKAGYETEYDRIEEAHASQKREADLHLFLFPVYAFAVPHIMRQYIRKLPAGTGEKTVVLSTNGRISVKTRDGYEGQALMQARRMLQRRGYNVFLTDTLDYPHSITNILNPPRLEAQTEIIRQAGIRLEKIAEKISKGETSLRVCNMFNHLWSWPFGWLYSLIGRRFLGKCYVADHTCTSCGRCAKVCPVQAIQMRSKKPRWKWNCEGCERCINSCPVNAIQTSAIRGGLMIGLMFYNPLFWRVFSFFSESAYKMLGNVGGWIFANVVGLSMYCIVFYLLDKLLFLLERIPGLRRLFELAHTKKFRRYLAPGFRP